MCHYVYSEKYRKVLKNPKVEQIMKETCIEIYKQYEIEFFEIGTDHVTASAKSIPNSTVINIDGEDYYMAGAPDRDNGATDIPGHYWLQIGTNKLIGKHFNTGPFGAPKWWSSDAPDGQLLYIVLAAIDTWSPEKAEMYAALGYVHYHELVNVADGTLHPNKVVWLKHLARTSFTLDGGPHPEFGHTVVPGVDLDFIPNGSMPYMP